MWTFAFKFIFLLLQRNISADRNTEAFCLCHTFGDEIESSTWIFYHKKYSHRNLFRIGRETRAEKKIVKWKHSTKRDDADKYTKYKLSLQSEPGNVGCERNNMINGCFIQEKLLTAFQCYPPKEKLGHGKAYWIISLWLFGTFHLETLINNRYKLPCMWPGRFTDRLKLYFGWRLRICTSSTALNAIAFIDLLQFDIGSWLNL